MKDARREVLPNIMSIIFLFHELIFENIKNEKEQSHENTVVTFILQAKYQESSDMHEVNSKENSQQLSF